MQSAVAGPLQTAIQNAARICEIQLELCSQANCVGVWQQGKQHLRGEPIAVAVWENPEKQSRYLKPEFRAFVESDSGSESSRTRQSQARHSVVFNLFKLRLPPCCRSSSWGIAAGRCPAHPGPPGRYRN